MMLPKLASGFSQRSARYAPIVLLLAIITIVCAPFGEVAHARKPLPSIKRTVPVKAATPAAAMPPSQPFPDDIPTKLDLSVGGLRATIAASDLKTAVGEGSASYLNLIVEGNGAGRQVSLIAEAEAGGIRSINGSGVKSFPVQGGLAAQFTLPPGGKISIAIEFVLKTSGKTSGGKRQGRLRLTLLPQTGGHDETIIALPLTDCAGDYKAELAKLDSERRQRMVATLEYLSATEPRLPATWLFPPPPPVKPTVVACKLPKGGRQTACPVTLGSVVNSGASADDARIFAQANSVLANKGALAQFQHRTQPMKQASFTLLNSLRMYMEQDPHPALCAGVDYMISYYQSRTSLVKSTIIEAQSAFETANSLAIARVAAFAAVSNLAADKPDGLALANLVGTALLSPTDAAALAGDSDIWSKLRSLRVTLEGPLAASLSADRRAGVIDALSAIEASQYLAIAAAKYSQLDDAVYGTMSAISDAHKRTCQCGP